MADGAEATGWANQGEEGENDLLLFLACFLSQLLKYFYSIFQNLEVVI